MSRVSRGEVCVCVGGRGRCRFDALVSSLSLASRGHTMASALPCDAQAQARVLVLAVVAAVVVAVVVAAICCSCCCSTCAACDLCVRVLFLRDLILHRVVSFFSISGFGAKFNSLA